MIMWHKKKDPSRMFIIINMAGGEKWVDKKWSEIPTKVYKQRTKKKSIQYRFNPISPERITMIQQWLQ